MNDTVPTTPKFSQQLREHGRSLSLCVVKKNNAPVGYLDSAKYQLQLLVGRHRKPIARPYICAKHYNSAPFKIIEQRR